MNTLPLEPIPTEDEPHRLNLLLEERVRERTAQLEAANRELECFSYSISHDLRAPLRSIDGFARILAQGYAEALDSEGRHLVDVIRDEARRMGRLIDDLLEFSRLGRQPIEPVLVDMDALARSVVRECRRQEPSRTLTIEIDPLPTVLGDQALLRQVWINLLSNAFKFTRPSSAPHIHVGSRIRNGQHEFFVRDNGVGFDMRYATKLFGVFQRLHKETEFEGTGVGLSLVQRIVLRHRGHVWAKATPNQGACFHFSLPAVPNPDLNAGSA